MEVTEADAEPEAEQEEAGQMRDTDAGSAAAATPSAAYYGFEPPPGWEQWSMGKRRTYKQRQQDKQRRGVGGGQGRLR